MTEKCLGNCSIGSVFVLSAPAGTGKTTLVQMLVKEFSSVEQSISCTTRELRKGEVQGRDYFFVKKEEFQDKIKSGDFLEYAEVFGEFYGTTKVEVEKKTQKGHHVILVIDTQGAMQLKEQGFKASYIFIAPPTMCVLEERLEKRQTESESKRQERLSWAAKEMECASSYDYLIVNEKIEVAYDVLRSILIAEEHKNRNR